MTYAPFSSVLKTFLPFSSTKSVASEPGVLSSIQLTLTLVIVVATCSPLTVTVVGSCHALNTLYSNAGTSFTKLSPVSVVLPPKNFTELSPSSVISVIASEGVASLTLNSCAPTVAIAYLSPPTELTVNPPRFQSRTNAISVYCTPSVVYVIATAVPFL